MAEYLNVNDLNHLWIYLTSPESCNSGWKFVSISGKQDF